MSNFGKVLENVKENNKVWSVFKLAGNSGEVLDEFKDWYQAYACTPVLPNTGKCVLELEI